MAAPGPPLLHILYQAEVARLTDAEFVNADRLAFGALGHHALTQAEAELGQRLAEGRRGELLRERRSLVTESTFSHPSKLELIREAKAAGYRVAVYHVNVDSADLAVARVQARLALGGHPVPEDRIRGRYERNQALIGEAVHIADWGFVFDNSRLGAPPRQLLAFANGQIRRVLPPLPAWAQALYGPDLRP
jgi:predicted ABC-type ATPase